MAKEASIPEKILDWAKTLPLWQQDALRRLFLQSHLTEEDKAEVRRMMLLEGGLETTAPTPIQLSRAHMTNPHTGGAVVRLTGLTDVKGVNALVEGQSLAFSPEGLTVIYGENGAGKSGYARILKSACRARDTEDVLPDIRQPAPVPASAKLVIGVAEETGERTETLAWPKGDLEGKLRQFSVFDSACALRIIKDPAEPDLGPTGLEVFEPFVKTLEELKKSVQDEAQQLRQKREGAFQSLRTTLRGSHEVGRFLEAFPKGATPDIIVALANQTPEDANELGRLELKLAEMKANDPMVVAKRIEALRARCAAERSRIGAFARLISPDSIQPLQEAQAALLAAQEAADAAAKLALSEEPLAGVGSQAWRTLFEAARAYSTEFAYTAKPFPAAEEGDRCVLCMQPLEVEAQERLLRFESFVQNRVAKNLASAQARFESLRAALKQAVLAALDGTLGSELEPECPGITDRLSRLILDLTSAQKPLLEALERRVGFGIPSVDLAPLVELERIESALGERIEKIKVPVDPTEGQRLQAQIEELKARKALGPHQEMLIEHRANLIRAEKLSDLASRLSSGAITTKGKALTTEALEGRYGQALKKELDGLQCHFMPLGFKLAASKGKAFQRIQFSDVKGNHSPELVLSEGEQRVAAIAAFLAEVQLMPAASGIILDDPVSSLDHRWAFRIAKRLVEEAKRRQVIIFTHNLSFLWDLVESAKLASAQVPCAVITVVAHAKQPGHLHEGVPYDGEKVDARMKVLAEMVQRARAIFLKDPDGDEYRTLHYQFFARMRGTWERVVEEVLFGGVVRRFQNAVKTQSLKVVQVGDQDHQIIYRGMTTASRSIEAHDRAEGVLFSLSTPDEMGAELEALKIYFTDLRKEQINVEKRRKVWEKGLAGQTS